MNKEINYPYFHFFESSGIYKAKMNGGIQVYAAKLIEKLILSKVVDVKVPMKDVKARIMS